jgi:subtilase family serine protease
VVIGQSAIDLNDIRTYRAAFNLPANDPKVVLVPGSTNIGHIPETELEADLDLEVLGAVARGANLVYVQDADVNAAMQYAIDQNLGSVISSSYAGAEYIGQTWGTEQSTWQLRAQEANAQGITIVSASGDTGAAGAI